MAEEDLNLEEDQEDENALVEAENDEGIKIEQPKKSNQTIIIGAVMGLILVVGITFGVSKLGKKRKVKYTPRPAKNNSVMVKEEKEKKEKKRKKKIKYEVLFNQLGGEDSSKILQQLSFAGIHFKTEQTGKKFTILVDKNEHDKAANLLALKGIPSGSAKKGYELLDDSATLGVTEFDKRIRFLRALSGELEKAITEFSIIESAKVQIVLPEQRLFTVTQPPVTAAILIRIMAGKESTDEIVYSIIHLVANAVENLQPENTSIIDTEGNLLSEGIFERLAEKKAGTYVEEKKKEEIKAIISREEAIGTPIIPNYDMIQEWFDIKWNFENKLKEKTEKQLFGILPLGSFKVEITTDIGPLENGNIIDIKRQTISIVIDGLNDEITVDMPFKQQVFTTVAGAVGYKKNRDTIQLSVAEYALYTEQELKALKRKYAKKDWMKGVGMLVILVGLIGGLYWGYRQWMARSKREKGETVELKEELEELKPIEEYHNKEKIIQIKEISNNSPELLAQVMEGWIQTDINNIGEKIIEEKTETEEMTEEEVTL